MSTQPLFLLTRRVACSSTPTARAFSTAPALLNKASRARTSRPAVKPPQPSPIPDNLRGTGAGADPRLYGKDDTVVGRDEVPAPTVSPVEEAPGIQPEPASPAAPAPTEALGGQTQLETDAEPRAFPSAEQQQRAKTQQDFPNHGEEETIYTANPPFNVPLVMTTAFVMAVFALSGADMARQGLAQWNEETNEYDALAPAWKRYTFAGGFAGASMAIIAFGAIAPGRIVTKLTLRRPAGAPQGVRFPRDGLVTVHTPITRLPGLSPRVVELGKIQLLGPLASRPRPYHPRDMPAPNRGGDKPAGPLSRLLRPVKELLIAPASPKKHAKPWSKSGVMSHVPIHIPGDKFSMSLAIKRGTSGQPHDPTGAWCADWEGLERALLGVKEVDTQGRPW